MNGLRGIPGLTFGGVALSLPLRSLPSCGARRPGFHEAAGPSFAYVDPESEIPHHAIDNSFLVLIPRQASSNHGAKNGARKHHCGGHGRRMVLKLLAFTGSEIRNDLAKRFAECRDVSVFLLAALEQMQFWISHFSSPPLKEHKVEPYTSLLQVKPPATTLKSVPE